jgi:hypothetical protein
VLIGDRIFYYGGGDEQTAYYDDMHVLNITTLEWTKIDAKGELPGKRRAHTCEAIGKMMYLFGGGDGSTARNDLHVLDTESMTWSKVKPQGPAVPGGRGYQAGCVFSERFLFISGGSDGKVCYNDTWVFDTQSSTWYKLQIENPGPRFAHTLTMMGPWLVLFAGHNSKAYDSELWLLMCDDELRQALLSPGTLATKKFRWVSKTASIAGQAPDARGYHSAVLVDQRLIVIGGFDSKLAVNDVHVLDLGSYAHFTVSDQPTPPRATSAITPAQTGHVRVNTGSGSNSGAVVSAMGLATSIVNAQPKSPLPFNRTQSGPNVKVGAPLGTGPKGAPPKMFGAPPKRN